MGFDWDLGERDMCRGGIYVEGIEVEILSHVEPMHDATDDDADTRPTPDEGGWPTTLDGRAPAPCSRGVGARRRESVPVGVIQDHSKRVLFPMV